MAEDTSIQYRAQHEWEVNLMRQLAMTVMAQLGSYVPANRAYLRYLYPCIGQQMTLVSGHQPL